MGIESITVHIWHKLTSEENRGCPNREDLLFVHRIVTESPLICCISKIFTIANIAVKSFEQSLSCIIRRDHSRQTRAKIAKGQKMKEITTTATAPLESLMFVSIDAVNAASSILNQRWSISEMR